MHTFTAGTSSNFLSSKSSPNIKFRHTLATYHHKLGNVTHDTINLPNSNTLLTITPPYTKYPNLHPPILILKSRSAISLTPTNVPLLRRRTV